MKISDFAMKGTHGFLGLFKYGKELHASRERQNIRNWTAVEVVLGSILNASGSQKMEVVQICSRVECVWAS